MSPEVVCQLEHFVCLLYKSKSHTKVHELRWFLYSNRAAEGENLPPTTGSLKLNIQQAHFIAMIWKRAVKSHPLLPLPSEYGWERRCLNPPAPEAVMNLVKCGCKKGCARCSCCSNNIACTELCGCVGYLCNNKANHSQPLVTALNGDESDSEM